MTSGPELPKSRKIKIALSVSGIIFLLAGFTHCVIEPPKSATKVNSRGTASSTDTATETSTATPPTPVTPTPVTPAPVPPVGSDPGREFFDQTVLPNFQNNCMVCHTEPINQPPLPGPLTIYNYDQMKASISTGTNATDNNLVRKVQGLIGHAGGNRCPGGINDAICKNITDWYAIEFQAPPITPSPPPVAQGLAGMVTVVSSLGKVSGYAANAQNLASTVGVNFYLDGPSGAGILLNNAPISANQAGFNGGYTGAHAFSYFLPILYRDGLSHTLYAYAVENNVETQLQGSPYTFTAYVSSIDGYNYYNATVRPLLQQRCASCHSINYDQHFGSLLSPSPANGGTMTDNEMINMPAGRNMNTNHPGGNLCGSKDNSPCVELQTWWDLEFN
jgi:mono/diheme cytochrome c family protein